MRLVLSHVELPQAKGEVDGVEVFEGGRQERQVSREKRDSEKRRRSGSLGAVAEQTLGNVALVQASRREGAELDRYHREGEGVIAAELSSVRIRGVFSPLVD